MLVHGNVVISVAAASVSVTTMHLADLPLLVGPPFVVFAVTMFVYSANRVLDLEADARNVPSRAAFTRDHGRTCLAVGTLLYAGAALLALSLGLPHVEVMLLPLVVTVCYSLAGLQRLPLVKNLLVGGSWGLIPLGTAVYVGAGLTVPVLVLAGYVTCLLTAAAMVFDIKDIDGDRAAGIRTIPVCFGTATTRRLAQAVNWALAVAVVALVASGVVPTAFLALLAYHWYVGAYVTVATRDRGPLFYGLVVDGEHVAVAALVTLLDAVAVLG